MSLFFHANQAQLNRYKDRNSARIGVTGKIVRKWGNDFDRDLYDTPRRNKLE
ncbi:hypothetical protein J18TS1_20270 [Oceanobacillus oncorhynchi subsp. incaldanensis]|nr:hypothetical protein J18TS1_20270 [Oceanobacillus oncorhynchi subsp. incaldanensis]